MQYDKIILIHFGALGDFCMIWPGLHALSTAFPTTPLLQAGREDYRLWTEPLGIRPANAEISDAVLSIHSPADIPAWLESSLIIRFGLRPRPEFDRAANYHYIGCIREDRVTPPRDVVLEALAPLGVSPSPWREAWHGLFGKARGEGRRILIFPGAGHEKKQWPLERFLALAESIAARGLEPCFVLGPAELERGMALPGHTPATPQGFHELCELLLNSRAVVGNDCGPMHLAAHFCLPGVVLFGPTTAERWKPVDLTALGTEHACRPCVDIPSDIVCPRPVCMEGISFEAVEDALFQKYETGLIPQ